MTLLTRPAIPWTRVFLAIVALNAIFLVVSIVPSCIPSDQFRGRILDALEEGVLVVDPDADFRHWPMGDDCLVLQMIINQDQNLLEELAGPLVYHQEDWKNYCGILLEVASTGERPKGLPYFHYTRYWHGNKALISGLAAGLDIRTVKATLKIAFVVSVFLLFSVAWRAKGSASVFGIVMALTLGFVWAMNYLATSFVHGPASCALVIGFAIILERRSTSLSSEQLAMPYAVFGAVLAFLEYFSGLLPMAGAMLLPLTYFMTETIGTSPAAVRQRLGLAVKGVFVFVMGAAITIILKQLLAIMVTGPESIQAFVGNLVYYTQEHKSGDAGRLATAMMVAPDLASRWGHVLTFGHKLAAKLLFLSSGLACAVATAWILMRPSADRIGALVASALGVMIIAIWMGVFPIHTFGHGWFMIRLLAVPIAIGWALLLIQSLNVRNG